MVIDLFLIEVFIKSEKLNSRLSVTIKLKTIIISI